MITVISGGKESLKLIRAFRNILYDDEISVIANTSGCFWTDGNLVCPDLDDLIYLFSGNLNTAQWRGIKGDSFSTQKLLNKISEKDAFFPIGDKERAVCIARSNILRNGGNITDAAKYLCRFFKITSKILPGTDNRYSVYAEMDDCLYPPTEFRELFCDDYNAEFRASVVIDCKKIPQMSEDVLDIINKSDAVIIGPERTNTIILPILAIRHFRKKLKNKFVITILPNLPVDYSDEKYPSCKKMLEIIRSVSDVIIQDIKEEINIEGSVRLNTTLDSWHKSESLAWEIMSIVRSKSR